MTQPRTSLRARHWAGLALIIAAGGLLRTYIWFHGYAVRGVHGLFRHGDGYVDIARTFANGGEGFFTHYRAKYQFVYPLYLGPAYGFGLDDSTYVFWLHHALVAGTIVCLFLAARRLFGLGAAFLTALVYAGHIQMAYWFNWALSDMAFHFHMALFLLALVRAYDRRSPGRLAALAGAAFLMMFTRPEGMIILAALVAAGAVLWVLPRAGAWRTAGLVAVVAVLAVGALVGALTRSTPFREAVMSHINVGWMLYYGTQRTPTNAGDVDKMILAMHAHAGQLSAEDPQHHNEWYWASVVGWERLRQRPLHFMALWGERLLSTLFPSFYREGVSLRYRLFDYLIALFVYPGVVLGLREETRRRPLLWTVLCASAAVYLFTSSIQSEWDVRVQLSPHVFLIPIAAFGWMSLARRLAPRVPGRAGAALVP